MPPAKTNYISPRLAERFDNVQTLSEDNYCLGNSGSAQIHGVPNLHKIVDYEPARIYNDLTLLKNGYPAETPLYAYEKRERREETVTISPTPVIIMEGCYLLQPVISDLFDIRLFINTDDHTRFVRRMMRPRRNPEQNDTHRVKEYVELSYPGYHQEIAPFANNAHIVIDNPYNPSDVANFGGVYALRPPNDSEIVAETHFYTHPKMTETEQLSVSTTAEGVQTITYLPDHKDPTVGVRFQVPKDEYFVDLSRVGYDLAA